MKIGILTFLNATNNYGQVLQAYALCTYLSKLGHDVIFINYKRFDDYNKSFFLKIKHNLQMFSFSQYMKRIKVKISKSDHNKTEVFFDDFREKYFVVTKPFYSYEQLKNDSPEVDCIIVGSDQVWNFLGNYKYLENNIKTFFLEFANENVTKISYAASFGSSTLTKKLQCKLHSFLSSFEKISVRESDALNICLSARINNVEWVMDPCFLLNNKEWLNVSGDNHLKTGVFYYFVENNPIYNWYDLIINSDCLTNYICAKEKRSRKNYNYISPSIEDWITYIKKSQYIVTNSYHGMVFSILFKKQFVIVPLRGKYYSSMNNRVYTLLERLGLIKRLLTHKDDLLSILNTSINWKKVDGKLELWKQSSKDFLNL